MGNGLFSLIKQVSVFIVCAQMLQHFRPAAQYGKYIKLLIGVMVLAQLFVPVMSLLGEAGETAFSEGLQKYQKMIADGMETAGLENVVSAERIEKMRIEEIKTILNNYEEQENGNQNMQEAAETVAGNRLETGLETEKEPAREEIYIERIEVKPDD